ncbi:MAG TPA: hypothetical protein P5277_02105 [Candidatus Paceibacterota bacterium]|nr:hypothetical protein [Candidatus Paceibacterota bacterium]
MNPIEFNKRYYKDEKQRKEFEEKYYKDGIFLTPLANDERLCSSCSEMFSDYFRKNICRPMEETYDEFHLKLNNEERSKAIKHAKSLVRCIFYKPK